MNISLTLKNIPLRNKTGRFSKKQRRPALCGETKAGGRTFEPITTKKTKSPPIREKHIISSCHCEKI